MRVFIVGKTTAETPEGIVWEVQGAFATEGDAVSACLPGEWIGPLEMGVRVPNQSHAWPGAYYPHDQ